MARTSLLPLLSLTHSIIHAHVIDCSLPEHECANNTVSCVPSEPCFISCYASECTDSLIECPLSADCSIECFGENSCSRALISGPQQQRGDLAVYCLGDRACLGTTIDGSSATQLEVNGCSEFESCLDISIYAPQHRNGSKRCVVHGNDNLGGTRLFAVNSWRDIDVAYSGHFGEYDGRMFCGADLMASCEISASWTCMRSTDFCSVDEFGEVLLPAAPGVASSTLRPAIFVAESGSGSGGGGFEDYLLVGAGVLALALAWMICGVLRHVCKRRVVRQKSEKMGYNYDGVPYAQRVSTATATEAHIHRVNTEFVDPFEEPFDEYAE